MITTRQRRRIAKGANKFHDALMLVLLKKIQELNSTDGEEVADLFGRLDREWKKYIHKHHIVGENELFTKNVKLMIARIEKMALEKVKLDEPAVETGGN